MDMGEGEGSESGVVHGGFVLVVAKGELYLPQVPTGSCCVERSRGCARIEFRNSADAPFGTPTTDVAGWCSHHSRLHSPLPSNKVTFLLLSFAVTKTSFSPGH